MPANIYNLSEPTPQNIVGNKAHSLHQMIHAGLNVPAGFVVTAGSSDTDILTAFDALQTDYVAVRSSAINEDGLDAAWAGQLDTFLNTTRATLVENIRRCQQSAESERAQAYGNRHQQESGSVAVIVQAMVQSNMSGVAFSTHPITQNNDHMVIEAAHGLGEAVVSGEITPDTYVIEKNADQIIEKHVSKQVKQLTQHGWQAINGDEQKLSDNQIIELGIIITKLEAFFNHPVDVEWAICDNQIYILQSRPITTLL